MREETDQVNSGIGGSPQHTGPPRDHSRREAALRLRGRHLWRGSYPRELVALQHTFVHPFPRKPDAPPLNRKVRASRCLCAADSPSRSPPGRDSHGHPLILASGFQSLGLDLNEQCSSIPQVRYTVETTFEEGVPP